jgi:hypothetical protein
MKRGLVRPVPIATAVRSELEAANIHVNAWCWLEVDVRPSRALASTTTTSKCPFGATLVPPFENRALVRGKVAAYRMQPFQADENSVKT